MKKIIYIFTIALIVLSSCDKNEIDALKLNQDFRNAQNIVTYSGYKIENGYIRFDNIESYDSITKAMSNFSNTELIGFKSSLGFTSLYDVYNKLGSPIDSTNNRVKDDNLSILLNQNGILMVGDSILKIVGENAYIITDANFSTLDKISKGIDVTHDKNVLTRIHSKTLKYSKSLSESNNGMMKLRGGESAYDGFVQTGLKKSGTNYASEERVKLGAFCVISPFWPFGDTYIGAEMNGEARNKDVWWGKYWGDWFNHKINYGKITINSGKWGPSGNCINDVVTGFQEFTVPDTEFKIGERYGATNNLYAKDLSVTYVYRKTAGYSLHTTTIVWE